MRVVRPDGRDALHCPSLHGGIPDSGMKRVMINDCVPARRAVGFTVDGVCYGLPLETVERVVRAVEITPLPEAPEVILGVINVHGRIVAVADVRKRFRLPERPVELHDKIVITETASRPLALVVDEVHGVVEYSEPDAVSADQIIPGVQHVAAIAKTRDGLIVIQDLNRFLGLAEQASLHRAMRHD